MKRIFYFLCIGILYSIVWGSESFLNRGDFYYNQRNKITITAKAIENINKAIDFYQKALEQKQDAIAFYKITKAIDFKYNFLTVGDEYREEKFDTLKSLIERINIFCNKNNCNDSKHIVYSKAILIGRLGELMNIMDAASGGIAEKIKNYSERLMQLDEKFENYAAYLILGRLHYKAPNIIFILTWPDKKKSKEYLEKYLEKEADSLTGIYFLADTLWEIGEKEKAKELYDKVINSKPRKDFYYEDKQAQEEVIKKLKNQ